MGSKEAWNLREGCFLRYRRRRATLRVVVAFAGGLDDLW